MHVRRRGLERVEVAGDALEALRAARGALLLAMLAGGLAASRGGEGRAGEVRWVVTGDGGEGAREGVGIMSLIACAGCVELAG